MSLQKLLISVLLSMLILVQYATADLFSTKQHTWPAGVIAYSIDNNVNQNNAKAIKESINYYNALTNINFVEITLENMSKYPHYVKFVNTPLIGELTFYNLCDIGAPYGAGVRYARIATQSYMSKLETQHCLGRVIGLHDEIKRSDRDEFVDLDETLWAEILGPLLYPLVQLDSGSFGYKMVDEAYAYNFGEYNYRGILGFNDLTEASVYKEDKQAIVMTKEEKLITSELYFDDKDFSFMQENSLQNTLLEDLRGVYFLLHSDGRIKSHDDSIAFAKKIFSISFMEVFEAEYAHLNSDQKIDKLQHILNQYIGYDIHFTSEEAYLKNEYVGKELLMVSHSSNDILFRFFDSEGKQKEYKIPACSIPVIQNDIYGVNSDDSQLTVLQKMNFLRDVMVATGYTYDISNNILEANLVWFNQQNIDAINSVYTKKADLNHLPYEYKSGLYYVPCRNRYRGYGRLCIKNFWRSYRRPAGRFSAGKLPGMDLYNHF